MEEKKSILDIKNFTMFSLSKNKIYSLNLLKEIEKSNISKLLKIIFDILKDTKELNEKIREESEKLYSDDTTIMGIKFLEIPREKLIDDFDEYFSKYKDTNKYPLSNNMCYFIYELNILEKTTQGNEWKKIIHEKEKTKREYEIKDISNAIFYLLDEAIPEYINDILKEKLKINKLKGDYEYSEIIKNIEKQLFKIILDYHKNTRIEYNKYNEQLLLIKNLNSIFYNTEKETKKFTNKIEEDIYYLKKSIDVRYENYFIEEYLNRNVIDKLLQELKEYDTENKQNFLESILYVWAFVYHYGLKLNEKTTDYINMPETVKDYLYDNNKYKIYSPNEFIDFYLYKI